MPKIFISYSRVDRNFVDDFVPLLREVYGRNDVWVDDELRGGQVWWDEILRQIARCDVFIYLLSNESLESSYCQAEYQEALRLNKLILPVQIRSRTRIPPELSRLQFVDLSSGVKDSRGMTRLYASIGQLVANAPTQPTEPLAPNPIPVPDVTLTIKRPSPNGLYSGLLIGSVVILVFIVIALNVVSQLSSPNPSTQATLNLSDPIIVARATRDTNLTMVAASTSIFHEDQTATATLWTPTPTLTLTPTITPSSTLTPTITPTLPPYQLAQRGVQSNAEWQPYLVSINGIEMMLVPAGCFNMGSRDGDPDEKPVEEFCFKNPFWIDRTEVTNKQYGSYGRFSGDNHPRETVSWNEARAFCELRDARLPTEAEWEYAARGPDELEYPWGNDFVSNNVVYGVNSNNQSAEVGSRPNGKSWVGTLDMIGNLWEWVSSIVLPYPYVLNDGRENLDRADVSRGLRGGSFYDSSLHQRATNRDWTNPTGQGDNVGFRCAKDY